MRFQKSTTRHIIVGILSFLLIYVFYLSRPELAVLHRFWRATGDAGFVLLFLTLCIGPLAKLWKPASKLIVWRRQLGIWFALISLIHVYSILNDWIKWDWLKFWGYEYIPQLGRYARLEPGFGLANLLGIIALFWSLILAATSSDKALKLLGGSTWKWIQNGAYVIFYLVGAHAIYFLFIHFTQSFHNNPLPANWFRFYAVGLIVILLVLQASALVKSVIKRRQNIRTLKEMESKSMNTPQEDKELIE